MPTFLAQLDGGGLVLLRPDRGVVRTVPGAADLVADHVVQRDGWFALGYNMRAWSLKDSCDEPPVALKGLHPASHEDPGLIWLNEGRRAISVNHEGQATREAHDLPEGSWLVAAFKGRYVTWNPDVGRCTWHGRLRARDLGRFFIQSVSGQYAFLVETGGGWSAAVLDIKSGDVQTLPLEAGTWDLLNALSPHGTEVAVTVQTADPGQRRPEGMPFSEWMPIFRAQPRRASDRELQVVTLSTGTVRRATELLADLPRMVWSADGTTVTCWVNADEDSWSTYTWAGELLNRVPVPSDWPVPLSDVSGTAG